MASVLFVDGVILLAWQLRDPLHGPVVALKAFVRAVIAWSYS